jgi:hypothetical protein
VDIHEAWEFVDDIHVAEILKIWFAFWVGISATQKLVEREMDIFIFIPLLGEPPEAKVVVERPCHGQGYKVG